MILFFVSSEAYVAATHDEFLGGSGGGIGWDRYLDAHLGFALEDGAQLDTLALALSEADVPHRAHVDADGARTGSLWSAGFSAAGGAQFWGNVSDAWRTTLDALDYCSPDSSSRSGVDAAEANAGQAGGDPTQSPTRHPIPAPTAAPVLAPTPLPIPAPSHTPFPAPTTAPIPAPTPAPTTTPPLAVLRLYKRTHFSSHARADAAFLARGFGIDTLDNYTYVNRPKHEGGEFAGSGFECARRVEMRTLDFQYHLFESFVTNEGNVTTAEWVAYWRSLHTDFSGGWDAFMALGSTFYVPDVTPFAEKLTEMGAPTMRVRYANPIDSTPMFSLAAVVPNTGHLIEVVSEQVADALRDGFSDGWPAGACGPANAVGYSVEHMHRSWEDHRGAWSNSFGLPDLLLVKARRVGRSVYRRVLVARVAQRKDVCSLLHDHRVTVVRRPASAPRPPRPGLDAGE